MNACLHELVEAQAARTPSAVAIDGLGATLSYAELDRRANRVAHHLRRLGVGPEVVVGVCLERSPELVVALLGVLKAGGAYLPLDPGYPSDRLAFMLSDAQAPLVLTQRELTERVSVAGVRRVHLDELAQEPVEQPAGAAVGPDNLAYVIYTSGSTGRP
jgi:non-ribosomal peptide synthetase component F